MEILRSTMALPYDAPASETEALAHDQRQNAEYTGMLERAANALHHHTGGQHSPGRVRAQSIPHHQVGLD